MTKRESAERQESVEENEERGVCIQCGKEFVRTPAYQDYCSDECLNARIEKWRGLAKEKRGICVQCGQEFVRTKGYRHCCSEACQEKRETAGSAKGAQVTKDLWAVERAKTVVGDPDVKDTSGV